MELNEVSGAIINAAMQVHTVLGPGLLEEPYKQCLAYELRQRGFKVATGVIEGACRHLIKDRMDITGAKWTLETAEAVLKLRSLRSSGDFDEYWGFYELQEQVRIHADKIKQLIPLKPALQAVK